MITEEDIQVLNLVQAMLGNIRPALRAISITCTKEHALLRFVLERDDPEEREALGDITFEFQALQPHDMRVDTVITVSDRPLHELNYSGRSAYYRQEPDELA